MVKKKPCMLCGEELWAKYPYFKLLRQENSWSTPRAAGRICEDCFEKIKKETED